MALAIATRRRRRLAAVLLAPITLLAACGDDSSDSGTENATTAAGTTQVGATAAPASTTAPLPAADPAGVIKQAYDLRLVKLDPISSPDPTSGSPIQYLIYGTMLVQKEDGAYEPGLAKKATITDPSTITVDLQDGLKFSDGTTLDSAAVKASIERIVAANKPGTFRMAELGQVAALETPTPAQVVIKLKTPIAGSFYNLLAHNETLVTKPGATGLDANPIGAGPFKLESFQTEQSLKLVKNPSYFQADQIKVAGVEFVQATAGAAFLNALKSGTVDAAAVSPDQVAQAQGGDVKGEVTKNPDNVLWIGMKCTKVPALGDVKVRQALNYALDKAQLNTVVFEGKGDIMQGWWPGDNKFASTVKEPYKRDVAKAKQLLAEAGQTALKLNLGYSAGTTNLKFAEAAQQMWKEAGIDVALVPITDAVGEYYTGAKADMFITGQTRTWTDKITRNFQPGSVGNTCEPKDAGFDAAIAKLRAADPNGTEAVALWQEIQKYEIDNAWAIFGLIGTTGKAWNGTKLVNVSWRPNQVGQLVVDFRKAYVKK
ncbi:MAG: ABC transporter substrate-binding protein [Acidimicrobiia bacterium]